MCLDEHLQASVVADLLDNFTGASSYVNDKADATKASRTLICRFKTKKERLNLQQIISHNSPLVNDKEDNQILESTHVVVGVSYGAEAYSVITQGLAGQETEREDVEKKLSAFVKKLENAIESNQDFTEFKDQFSLQDKLWIARLNCRLYADLQTQADRECGVIDVYNYCLKLVEQMRTAGKSRAIPLTIRLCPLRVFAGKITGMTLCKEMKYRDVDKELVARISRLWVELEKLESKEDYVIIATSNKLIRDQLTQFFTLLVNYKRNLRDKLKEGILNVRMNYTNKEEDQLENVVNFAENNLLFNPSQLERWLCYKEKESEMILQITNATGAILLENKSQFKKLTNALVFYLPPLDEWTNKILEVMKNYVDDSTGCFEFDEDLPWYTVQHKKQVVFAKIRELADHVKNNKHLENRVQFFFAFHQTNVKGIRCSYSIYEGDTLMKANLDRLPSPPINLRIEPAASSSIRVEWDYDKLEYPCQFLVEFRLKGQSDNCWVQRRTAKPYETQTTIDGNQSAMEIRVAADTCIGRSEFCDVIETEYCWSNRTSTSLTSTKRLENDQVKESAVITINSDPFGPHHQPLEVYDIGNKATCYGDTQEHVTPTVIVVNDKYQRISEKFSTGSDNCQLVRPGQPNVYQLNATENSVSSDLRWFQIGLPNINRDHKVIILMGATGSGKSTLINGMVNYILGVQWNDPFRFKCIREDESTTRNQAHSQTSSVTAYTIHHQEGMTVPYSVTLIDTPGYGDTRGVGKDKEITDMIHRFLMGKDARIDHIHAACFVAASGDSRLTITQRYIFNSVLSIFGKDFKDNIRLLVTFADNATPPVVEACRVANFPVSSQSAGILYSKFNSSVLFSLNKEDDFSYDQLFWDMGQENFTKFFTMLEGMDGKDLKTTREVIQHRKLVERSLAQTECELEEYFVQIEALRRRMYGCNPTSSSSLNELNQLKANMLYLLNGVADSIRSLESSALRWNGFSLSDYLSLMMSRVAEEQKPGYEIRLETLAELQELIVTPEMDLPLHVVPPEQNNTNKLRNVVICLIKYLLPFAILVGVLELLRMKNFI